MPFTLQPMIQGHRHMVSAGHYLATEAGIRMLEAGGNAIDAGVAAGIPTRCSFPASHRS